jgi:hypothetical protein
MARILFDARELYFLNQYGPVYLALQRRGVDCGFVAYANREQDGERIRRAFTERELPTTWVETREEGLAHYQSEAPDWIVFGREYAYTHQLPEGTRTAMLYHGSGMKSSMYGPGLLDHDVRFMEGGYFTRRVRALDPGARVAEVGSPKIDPLHWPEAERPRLDLEALGLDPAKPTVLYAPTHGPSSFPNMSDRWPEEFGEFNLLVKAHQLSFFSSKRRSHREKMETWSCHPNVHVAPIESYDPSPYINAADVLVSDLSAVVFEFASTGKPVVWCDFLHHRWTRRGPLWFRRWQRLDREVIERFKGIAAHAGRYRELLAVVRAELDDAEAGAERRRGMAEELVGPGDGRSAERVADYLLGEGSSRESRPLKPAAADTPR